MALAIADWGADFNEFRQAVRNCYGLVKIKQDRMDNSAELPSVFTFFRQDSPWRVQSQFDSNHPCFTNKAKQNKNK